ncbi:MAG: ABC transporter permease [Thermomicrobiales bacterium]
MQSSSQSAARTASPDSIPEAETLLPHELPANEPIEYAPDIRDDIAIASQWKLMWLKFRKHRLAVLGMIVIILIYLIAMFAEFVAPMRPTQTFADYTYAPPQFIHVVDTSDGFDPGMFAYDYTTGVDMVNFTRTFEIDTSTKVPIGFFVKGQPYELFGLFPMDRHLVGSTDPQKPVFLLGTDRLGRDMFSRIVYGARISMSIGLIGVALSLVLGVALGGMSGYYGGWIDNVIQRVIEVIRAVPTIPLWMGLAAALPPGWSGIRVYLGITVILSLIGWTGLARVVRGRFLAMREEEFILAAKLDGTRESRIIARHMVPSFLSHIIASVTLSIPAMILAETSLSFLGLGLRPPTVSWGVLLQEAQNIRTVATAPWLFAPGIAIVIAVLAFNFMGDGLRDAADPYN